MTNQEKAREYYNSRTIEIKCKVCDKLFIGKAKMVSCSPECTRRSKLSGMEKHYHILECKDCKIIINETIKYGKKSTDKKRFKRCTHCSKKHRELSLNERNEKRRELRSNDPNLVKVEAKNGVFYTSQEKIDNISKKMKENNPMKNSEVSAKVSSTLKAKIASGELVYKSGNEHHLYKGNRDNYKYIRSNLQDWRVSMFSEANWKCASCAYKGNLEVHHLEKFTDIVSKFADRPISEYIQVSQEFQELCKCVIEYHFRNKQIGLVLCEVCHGEIDKQRKPSKKAIYENKKHKEKNVPGKGT